jgi:hypothetical protein
MIENANITAVPFTAIRPAQWRSTYTFKPELKLLTQSIRDLGWVSPILVRQEDSTIIDGFARWVVAQGDKVISKRDRNLVPVVYISCDEVDAMLHHVRLNRARGQVMARPLSRLISDAVGSGKYGREVIRQALGMTLDEFDMLRQPDVLISKKVKEHEYSRAWVPIEAPPVGSMIEASEVNAVAGDIVIERPPNPDR